MKATKHNTHAIGSTLALSPSHQALKARYEPASSSYAAIQSDWEKVYEHLWQAYDKEVNNDSKKK